MYAMLSLVWITLKKDMTSNTRNLPDTLLLNLLGGGAVEREGQRERGDINIIVLT